MREKSIKSKCNEKRGIPTEKGYMAWKRTNEAHSSGTGTMTYDPIAMRTVDTLSTAETKVYWILRFFDGVSAIYEQYPMEQWIVDEICDEMGVRRKNALSTDFYVEFVDGSVMGVSVKQNRDVFDKARKGYDRLVVRQRIEQIYWTEKFPVYKGKKSGFRIVFGDEINRVLISNIKAVMKYWDTEFVSDPTSKLKHLIAHKVIRMDLSKEPLRFAKIAESIDVEGMYETYRNETK